jgi:hypothetical protein
MRLFIAIALELHARGQTEHHQMRVTDFDLKVDPRLGEYLVFNMGSSLKNYQGRLNDGAPVSVGFSLVLNCFVYFLQCVVGSD